jgi:hypothetical protein
MRFTLLLFAFLMLSCSKRNSNYDEHVDIKKISSYGVDLAFDNYLVYSPYIKSKLNKTEDNELYSLGLETSFVLDSLIDSYILTCGGVNKDGVLVDPFVRGEVGIQLYNENETNEKLMKLISKINDYQTTKENELAFKRRINFIIKANFGNNSYFDNDKLNRTPLALLILELSIIENQIYASILESWI